MEFLLLPPTGIALQRDLRSRGLLGFRYDLRGGLSIGLTVDTREGMDEPDQ